jgi:hypothetical protein
MLATFSKNAVPVTFVKKQICKSIVRSLVPDPLNINQFDCFRGFCFGLVADTRLISRRFVSQHGGTQTGPEADEGSKH